MLYYEPFAGGSWRTVRSKTEDMIVALLGEVWKQYVDEGWSSGNGIETEASSKIDSK